jgi:hypothetical protein
MLTGYLPEYQRCPALKKQVYPQKELVRQFLVGKCSIRKGFMSYI